MNLPRRFAIVNRLTDVGRETALQVGKLRVRHRATCPFSQRLARYAALGYRFVVRGAPVNAKRRTPNAKRCSPPEKWPMSTIIERECPLTSLFL